MLNLYWKIFLGFWVTGLLLSGGAILVSQQLRQDLPLEIKGLSSSELVNRTSFIIRRVPDDFYDWQQELSEHDIFVFLDKSNEPSLSNLPAPEAITTIFNKLATQQKIEQSSFTRLLIGKQEVTSNGQSMNFVIDMPSVILLRLRQLSEQLAVQLALSIGLSALACYILARYLTRNLHEISSASRALAGGDLSARITVTNRGFNDELSILATDFNNMASSLQTARENQKRLVQDISHELRSPLARLQIALALARQQNESKELDRIELEANRLNDMIGQILERPNQKTELTDTIDLAELAQSIIIDNQIEATDKQVKLIIENNCAHTLVLANASQLHSAIENVVRNAIHYTDDHTTINITINTLPPNAEFKDGCYKVIITDDGPGVPEADLPFIFEPFYRVDPARNRKTGGYGVGLAIVHRVIKNHSGTVKAVNNNKGLSVEILLPILNKSV